MIYGDLRSVLTPIWSRLCAGAACGCRRVLISQGYSVRGGASDRTVDRCMRAYLSTSRQDVRQVELVWAVRHARLMFS